MESESPSELRDYEIPIFDTYALNAKKKLGSGSFGDVYLGRKLDSKEEIFAMKLENNNPPQYHFLFSNNKILPTLMNEFNVYQRLTGIERIPTIHYFGIQGNYKVLIMDLLGRPLNKLMDYIKSPFSLGTTLKLSLQILNILKDIHKRGIVCRYLKPENMAMGRGKNKDYVYLFDFGLAKRYIVEGRHIPYSENKDVAGNRIFISINAHSGKEISRRDDIECLGYNLVYFMKGKLPWIGMSKRESVRQKKIETTLDELCDGLPEEFKEFIKYARDLKFTDEPDYDYLKNLLLKAAAKNNIKVDSIKYDWEIYEDKLNSDKSKELKENEIKSDAPMKENNENNLEKNENINKENKEEEKIISEFEEKCEIKEK